MKGVSHHTQLFLFFYFFEILHCSPAWSVTDHVAQASLKPRSLLLLSLAGPELIGVSHHHPGSSLYIQVVGITKQSLDQECYLSKSIYDLSCAFLWFCTT